MTFLLVLIALAFGLGGVLTLSEATLGVGLVGLACLCAILARLHQAQEYHRQVHPAAVKESPIRDTPRMPVTNP